MDLPTGPTARPHRNHGLFSDHYLEHTLPGRPDREALADEARPVMEKMASVFESYASRVSVSPLLLAFVIDTLRASCHECRVGAPSPRRSVAALRTRSVRRLRNYVRGRSVATIPNVLAPPVP